MSARIERTQIQVTARHFAQLKHSLERLIDWHERGDMDSDAGLNAWFREDLAEARRVLQDIRAE